MNRDESQVTVSIHLEGDFDFEVSEVWPDGDIPAEVTAAAVVAQLEKGSKRRALDDWELLDDLTVDVFVETPNPHYQGDEVLFGDPPPKWLVSSAKAWDS